MLFHTHSFSLYSISLFAPTLIRGLGFATWRAQLLSTPPYALAFITTMATAYASYRVKRRAAFIILWDIVIIIGYIIMISTVQPAASYVGLFLVIAGIYSANALVLSWPSENISSQTKRATALGMQISIGNLGAITSTMIYVSGLSYFGKAASADNAFSTATYTCVFRSSQLPETAYHHSWLYRRCYCHRKCSLVLPRTSKQASRRAG